MRFFPVVGMVIGLVLFAAFWLLGYVIYSPMVMAVLLVIIEVVLTEDFTLMGWQIHLMEYLVIEVSKKC